MITSRTSIFLAALLAVSGDAYADIFRCSTTSGGVVFQATRCTEVNATPMRLQPLNVLGEPLRPGEQALMKRWERRSPRRRALRSDDKRPTAQQQRAAAERCLAKQHRLDAVSAQLRRGYKAGQGERLRRRRNEYAAYVRKFCD